MQKSRLVHALRVLYVLDKQQRKLLVMLNIDMEIYTMKTLDKSMNVSAHYRDIAQYSGGWLIYLQTSVSVNQHAEQGCFQTGALPWLCREAHNEDWPCSSAEKKHVPALHYKLVNAVWHNS